MSKEKKLHGQQQGKGLPKGDKFLKKTSSKTLRRRNRIVNEDSYILNSSTYRRDYEVQRGI